MNFGEMFHGTEEATSELSGMEHWVGSGGLNEFVQSIGNGTEAHILHFLNDEDDDDDDDDDGECCMDCNSLTGEAASQSSLPPTPPRHVDRPDPNFHRRRGRCEVADIFDMEGKNHMIGENGEFEAYHDRIDKNDLPNRSVFDSDLDEDEDEQEEEDEDGWTVSPCSSFGEEERSSRSGASGRKPKETLADFELPRSKRPSSPKIVTFQDLHKVDEDTIPALVPLSKTSSMGTNSSSESIGPGSFNGSPVRESKEAEEESSLNSCHWTLPYSPERDNFQNVNDGDDSCAASCGSAWDHEKTHEVSSSFKTIASPPSMENIVAGEEDNNSFVSCNANEPLIPDRKNGMSTKAVETNENSAVSKMTKRVSFEEKAPEENVVAMALAKTASNGGEGSSFEAVVLDGIPSSSKELDQNVEHVQCINTTVPMGENDKRFVTLQPPVSPDFCLACGGYTGSAAELNEGITSDDEGLCDERSEPPLDAEPDTSTMVAKDILAQGWLYKLGSGNDFTGSTYFKPRWAVLVYNHIPGYSDKVPVLHLSWYQTFWDKPTTSVVLDSTVLIAHNGDGINVDEDDDETERPRSPPTTPFSFDVVRMRRGGLEVKRSFAAPSQEERDRWMVQINTVLQEYEKKKKRRKNAKENRRVSRVPSGRLLCRCNTNIRGIDSQADSSNIGLCGDGDDLLSGAFATVEGAVCNGISCGISAPEEETDQCEDFSSPTRRLSTRRHPLPPACPTSPTKRMLVCEPTSPILATPLPGQERFISLEVGFPQSPSQST